MNVYLIRHGQTDWNVEERIQGRTDIPLNETGRRQAAALAEGMRKRPVTKVFSSYLSRAYDTARAIADSQQVEVEILEGLEEVGYGVWEGLTMEEIAQRYPEELRQWYNSPVDMAVPEGESQIQVYERCARALERVRSWEEGDVAVVTHGATNLFLLELMLRGDSKGEEEDLIVGNASISTLEYDPKTGACTLLQLNDREHLEGI